jgi:large subunit ribosomal protein L11
MAKKITGYINLTIGAGKANPSPPIGPALAQKKLNIMEFCKTFNAQTQSKELGTPIPVVISVYEDNSFTFVMKTSPASFYLKQCAKISKGASATKKEAHIGTVTMADCEMIAKEKMKDLNTNDLASATKMICGTAGSMGIIVVDGN